MTSVPAVLWAMKYSSPIVFKYPACVGLCVDISLLNGLTASENASVTDAYAENKYDPERAINIFELLFQ